MPRSRGRKKSKGTEQGQPSLQKSLERTTRQYLREILSSRWARFVEISGVVASIIAFWSVYVQARPKIEVVNVESPSPFLVPFAIKNESSLFSMGNVRWTCIIQHYEDENSDLTDIGLTRGTAESIGTESVANYRCPVKVEGLRITSLIVVIRVKYETLWWTRTVEAPFFWITDVTKPQWIAGVGIK